MKAISNLLKTFYDLEEGKDFVIQDDFLILSPRAYRILSAASHFQPPSIENKYGKIFGMQIYLKGKNNEWNPSAR